MDFWVIYAVAGLSYFIALIVMASKDPGQGKLPSYRQMKNLDKRHEPKRAISSYGG